MYIKRLELQGFKTFPERTKILFNPGITIIIGPNGTGKSNIVEAIQWVLGGQRVRTVRGEKTEDAIFNGTLKRPAVGMADVTLVLQNTEEEMQINHRVFRTGDGEYRLNGKAVRLKDIQEELWKRAISENKYYVIEQGSIGTFVTSKPTEKRLLIEEAAGTAYYRDKRRQAEHKLEGAELNLTRLEDIIAEVAKAKNSLARQAGAAERYRKLRERIRELTVLHFKHKGEQLQSGQREIQAQYDERLILERDTMARLTEKERMVNLKRKESWELEQTLKQGQERLFALKTQLARTEAERDREIRRVDDLAVRRRKSAADSDALLAELLALENDFHQTRDERTAQAETLAQREGEASDLLRTHQETEARIAPGAKKVEACRADAIQKLAEVTTARNEQAKLEKELELIRRQEEKLLARKSETQERLGSKLRDLAALETSQSAAAERISEREKALAEARRKAAEAAEAIETLADKIAVLKNKRDETAHHLQALRKLEAKEREAAAIPELPQAVGVFTDLVQSDPADAPLIDLFWKEEAKALIIDPDELLHALGSRDLKGNFLLLPAGTDAPVEPPPFQDEAVLGRLKARLRPSAKLGGNLSRLQDAYIVLDVAAAVRLWQRHPEHHYITVAGDILLSGGLLRIGQRKEGLFTFIQEIRDQEARLAVQDAEIAPPARELEEQTADRDRLNKEVISGAAELEALRREIVDAEKRTALAVSERDKLQNDAALHGHDLEILAMDREGFRDKIERHTVFLDGLTADERSLRERTEAEEREFAQHQERSNAETKSLLELRGTLELLRERIAGLQGRLQSLESRKSAAAARLAALQEEMRAADEEEDGLRRLIVEMGDKMINLDGQRAEQEDVIAGAEERRARVQEELGAAESVLARLREEHETTKDARMAREVRKAEVDRDLVNLEEACWQELKKNLAEVKADPAVVEPPEGDVEAELEDSQERIQRIGAVNLMAEEEYQAQKERYDFLIQQRTDLRDSIAQTKEAIRQIDEESRSRFLTALADVNRNFQDLFVTLFKGGAAEVKLLDENDPLESGVEVVAQPPGKKVQNMGLLSGGEKSLTSLAFLFALFRYKPTPFCILDEVDAALDETNLLRFLDLMKAIKSDTQFIIITHNYRTMEVADYIYGTTMEEPNVTKVFSMKLEKKGEAEPVV
jgi:chromosome segregation protein